MITLNSKHFNTNIKKYYIDINCLQPSSLTCSCKVKGSMIKHGFYNRSILTNNKLVKISILRVKCKSCGKTHAILPSFIIPYIRMTVLDMQEICIDIDNNIYKSSDDEVYRISKIYTKFKNKLLSLKLVITSSLEDIVSSVSNKFKTGFMQNHRGIYLVQELNHITY